MVFFLHLQGWEEMDMTNDEQNALRALLREEVNAAVYASEQRMGERMDKRFNQLEERMDHLEGRMGRLEDRMDHLEGRMGRLEDRMDHLEAEQKELKTTIIRIDVNLSEAVSVLGDATRVINELRVSQYAIESKVEDALLGLRRDMQTLTESVHTFTRHFLTLSQTIDERITRHERMGINETHPYPPHSAA
jgi:chromosome segregation ATPase